VTGLGWFFMATSVGGVTWLMLWCFHRVLKAPAADADRDDRAPPT
jgi:hypothetical protein